MPGRLGAQLDAVRQTTAGIEAALRAEVASLQVQLAQQPQRSNAVSMVAVQSRGHACNAAQLACISSDDDTRDAMSDGSSEAGIGHIAELLQALDHVEARSVPGKLRLACQAEGG